MAWDLSSVLAEQGPAGGHTHGEGVTPHNRMATVVVILGTFVAASGVRIALGEAGRQELLLFIASSSMFADGVVHFYVVSEHLGGAPFVAFFAATGAVQLVLGYALLRGARVTYMASAILTAGLIALFFVTRLVPPPFAAEPETFEPVGLISKALESSTLIALGLLLYRWRSEARAAVPAPPSAP